MTKTLRGAIYARRSQDLDTAAQIERVQTYQMVVERRLSEEYHEPVRIVVAPGFIFRDEGQSGLSLERTEYARLRQAVAAGALDVLLIHAIDRLGRTDDPTDMMDERRNFMRAGVRVFAQVGDYELTGDGETVILRYFLDAFIAGRELRTTRERTKNGKRDSWLRDNARWAFGGRRRYGFQLDPGNKHVTEHPEHARILRDMVNWALHDSLSGSEIAARLNLRGIAGPRGGKWHVRSVLRILSAPAIAGAGVTLEMDGHEYTIPTPQLIDPADFEALQRVLIARGLPKPHTPARYPLSGLMKCDLCGLHFTGYNNRGRIYYACLGRRRHAQLGIQRCAMPTFRTERVEGPIWQQVQAVLKEPALLQAALGDDPGEIERLEAEGRDWRGQLERKRQAQVRLVMEWNRSMDPQAVETALAGLNRDMEDLKRRLMELDYRLMILRHQAGPRDYSGVDLGRLQAEARAALVREVIHSIQAEKVDAEHIRIRVRYYPLSQSGQYFQVSSGPAALAVEPMEPIVLEIG